MKTLQIRALKHCGLNILAYTFNMNANLGDDGNLLGQNCRKLNALHIETAVFDISHFVHMSFPAELVTLLGMIL